MTLWHSLSRLARSRRARLLALETAVLAVLVTSLPTAVPSLRAQSFERIPINWVSGPSMPTDRVIPGVSASGGKIYVTGGINNLRPGGGGASQGDTLSKVEAFDIAANQWSPVADLPEATKGHGQVTTPEGQVWVAGGQIGSTSKDTLQVFDPKTGQWTVKKSMQAGRFRPGLAVGGDGKIYAIGGMASDFTLLSSVEAYDPVADEWSFVRSLPEGRMQAGAAGGQDGRIYAIGGYVPFGTNSISPSRDVLQYDPVANTWVKRIQMLNTTTNFAIAVGPDGRIWAAGGAYAQGIVEVYDPAKNAYQTATDLPGRRVDAGAAFGPDGRLYVVGGAGANNETLATMDIGTILENTPTPTATGTPTQTPTVTPTYTTTPLGRPAVHVFVPAVFRATQSGGW